MNPLKHKKPTNPNTPTPSLDITDEDIQRSLGANYNEFQSSTGVFNTGGGPAAGDSQYDPGTIPIGMNMGEYRAQQQTFLDKGANGILKSASNMVGVFGAGAGLLYGVGKAAVTGDKSDILNNNILDGINGANEWMEEKFSHYKTEKEENSNVLSMDNVFTANFLFDGIVKNFGFSLGAGALTKLGVKGVSKLLTPFVLKGAAGMQELEVLAKTAGTGEKLIAALQKTSTLQKAATAIENVAGSTLAAGSEAVIEGRETYDTFLKEQVDAYKKENNGAEPLPHQLKEFENKATDAGLAGLVGNMFILGISNFGQHTTGLAGSYKQALKRSVPGRLEKLTSKGSLLFSPSESLEEGLQTGLSSATKSYYSRKKDGDSLSDMDDMVIAGLQGLNTVTNTKEGLQSLLVGGVAGGMSKVALGGAKEAWNGPQNEYLKGQKLLVDIKELKEKNPIFATKADAAVRHLSIAGDMQKAVESGDVYAYQNLRHDSLKNLMQLHAELGTTKEYVTELEKMKSLPEEQFREALGLEEDGFDQKTASQYVDLLKAEAGQVAKTWQNIETSYPIASKELKEALYDNLTNIKNRDKREVELNQKILTATKQDYTAWKILNPEASDENYVAQVSDYLAKNPSADVTQQDVTDFLRLKKERGELVQSYQNLLNGKQPISSNSPANNGQTSNSATNQGLPATNEQEDAGIVGASNPTENEGVADNSTPEQRLAASNAQSTLPGTPATGTPTNTQTVADPTVGIPATNGQANTQPVSTPAFPDVSSLTKEQAIAERVALGNKYDNENNLAGATSDPRYIALSNHIAELKKQAATPPLIPAQPSLNFGTTPSAPVVGTPAFYFFTVVNGKVEGQYTTTQADHTSNFSATNNADGSVSVLPNPAVQAAFAAGSVGGAVNELFVGVANTQELFSPNLTPAILTKSGNDWVVSKKGGVKSPVDVLRETIENGAAPTAVVPEVIAPVVPEVVEEKPKLAPAKGPVTLVDWDREKGQTNTPKAEAVRELKNAIQQHPRLATTLSYYVVHENRAGRDTYNLYADTKQGPIDLGYLEQTDGKFAARFTGEEFTEALATNAAIKKAAMDNSGSKIPVSVRVETGIANLPNGQDGILLADAGNQYKLGTKTKIYSQRTKQGRTIVEDMDNPGSLVSGELRAQFPSDGYVLAVTAPTGNTRYIGLRTSPLTEDELLTVISDASEKESTDNQAEFLNENIFIAAQPRDMSPMPVVRRHAKFVSKDKVLGIQISTSEYSESSKKYKDVAESFIPVNLENLNAVQSSFLTDNPFRRQVIAGEHTDKDFTITTMPELWTSPKFILQGVAQPTAPVGTVTKEETTAPTNTPSVDTPKKGWTPPTGRLVPTTEENKDPLSFKTEWNADLIKTNFDAVRANLAAILPSWIGIDSLSNLAGGLYNNGYTWGAFTQRMVYLAERMPDATEYHEAFHAIYREVLSASQREEVKQEVLRKQKSLFSTPALTSWVASYPAYSSLSREELVDLRIEEWMADQFQEYMRTGRKRQGAIGRILEYLKNLVGWVKDNESALQELFSQIEKGAFVSAQPRYAAQGVAFKLAGATQVESARIVGSVTLQYINDFDKYQGDGDARLMAMIEDLKQYEGQLSPDWTSQEDAENWLAARRMYYEDGSVFPLSFSEPEAIMAEVKARLKKNGFGSDKNGMFMLLSKEELQAITNEQELSDPNEPEDLDPDAGPDVTFDKNGFSLTGFDSLGKQIKQFLTLLGHKPEGSAFYIPANSLGTYGRLVRLLHGKDTLEEMTNTIAKYAGSDPVLNDLYNKLVSKEDDPYFSQKFFNAFSVEFVPARHVQFTAQEEETTVDNGVSSTSKVPSGKATSFLANRKDEGRMQLEKYAKAYQALVADDVDIQVIVDTLLGDGGSNGGQTEAYLSGGLDVEDFKRSLGELGLDFQQDFLESVKDGKNDDYKPAEFWGEMSRALTSYAANPYRKQSGEEEDSATLALKRLGKADSKWRSDILSSSFTNAEGETQYSFIAPSYETVRARKLQQGMHGLDLSSVYYQNNWIVRQLAKDNKIPVPLETYSGIRETNKDTGMTFAKQDSKSMLVADHVLMNQGIFNWAQHEAKSTAFLINLSKGQGKTHVPDFVKNGKLADNAVKALDGFAAQENAKISRTYTQLYGEYGQGKLDSKELVSGMHFLEKPDKANGLPGGWDKNGKPMLFPKELVDSLMAEGKQHLLPNGLKHVTLPHLNNLGVADSYKDAHQTMFENMLVKYDEMLTEKDLNDNNIILLTASAKIGNTDREILDYKMQTLVASTIISESYAQLLRGEDYASYHASQVDLTKRGGGLIAAGRNLGEGNFTAALIADEKGSMVDSSGEAQGYDATDAQSYMSPARWFFYMKQMGKLNAQTENLAQKMVRGDVMTAQELTKATELITANSIKGVYFDGITYIKTSYIPLLPELTSIRDADGKYTLPRPGREKLYNMRMLMERPGQEIDELHRKTASKLQKKGLNVLDANNNHTGPLTTIEMRNDSWRLQVENPSGKTKVTQGTQLMQLIDAAMATVDKDGNPYMLTVNGKQMSVADTRKEFQRVMAENKKNSMEKAEALFGALLDGQSVWVKSIQQMMEASGGNQLQQDFFSAEGTGFKYSTDLPHLTAKYQEFYFSYFNKNVFGQKVPGMKCTLVESTGFTNPNTGKPLQIHRLENGKISLAEVILSEELLLKKGITREQFEALPQDQQDKIVTMLGFRIPTQAHHSMLPFKVVDWVPAYMGSVAIVPSEVVHLAGSDYDVDSIFIERTEWDVNKDGSIHFYNEEEETDADYKYYLINKDPQVSRLVSDYVAAHPEMDKKAAQDKALLQLKVMEPGKKTPYALSNTRLQAELAFLRNPANSKALHRPASMEQLTSMKKLVNKWRGVDENANFPYAAFFTRIQHTFANLAGKANVGPAANVSKTSAMLTKNGVNLTTPFSVFGKSITGFANLDEQDIQFDKEGNLVVDKDGNAVLVTQPKDDSISTLVSGMTDDAKERFSFALNLTKKQVGIVGLGTSLGIGFKTMLVLVNQPAIRELSKQQENANTAIVASGNSKELSEKLFEELNELRATAGVRDAEKEFEKHVAAGGNMDNFEHPVNYLTFTEKNMVDNLQSNSKLYSEEASANFYYQQASAVDLYMRLELLMGDFNAVNTILNTNKGVAISIADQQKLVDAYQTLTKVDKEGEPLSQIRMDWRINEGNIDANLKAVFTKIIPLSQKVFILATAPIKSVANALENSGFPSRFIPNLQEEMLSALTMKSFNQLLQKGTGKQLQDYLYLLTDPQTNIIQKLAAVATIPVVKENLLIKNLSVAEPSTEVGGDPYYRLEYNSFSKADPDVVQQISDSFSDLQFYTSPNEEEQKKVREFAQDLRIYLALKHNMEFRRGSFVSLLPASVFGPISSKMKEVKKVFTSGTAFEGSFYQQFGERFDDFQADFLMTFFRNPEYTRSTPIIDYEMFTGLVGQDGLIELSRVGDHKKQFPAITKSGKTKQLLVKVKEFSGIAYYKTPIAANKHAGLYAIPTGMKISEWQKAFETGTTPIVEQPTNSSPVVVQNQGVFAVEMFKGWWTRAQVAADPNKLYLFGDNTNDREVTKYVPSATQAVIRGLPNALGIDTKKDRGTGASSYFTDADLPAFKQHVDSQLAAAKSSGKTIVLPADGIGTGKAMLAEKAPKLMEYLQNKLQELGQNQEATSTFVPTAASLYNSANNQDENC